MSRRFLWTVIGVTVLMLCVVIGWFAITGHRQKAAADRIRSFGGLALHEFMHTSGTPSLQVRLLQPLTKYIHPDRLFAVTKIRTKHWDENAIKKGAPYTPTSFLHVLQDLPSVRAAMLGHCEIDNEDLAPLTELPELTELSLASTRLHEGSLPHINRLQVNWLSLARTRIDDESLKSLVGMNALQGLDLTRTKVTDDGLQHLAKLPGLKGVILRRTLVTEEGYKNFAAANPSIRVQWEPLKR